MPRFSTGKNAFGMCQRCGMRARYQELVSDGELPGLRVHESCRDIKHPAEMPFNATDSELLQRPAPDTDDDSPGDTGTSLVEAMGFTNSFGGAT